MRHPSSVSVSALAAAFALLLLPAALASQTTGSAPADPRPVGCRGTSSESSAISAPGPGGQSIVIPSYPTVVDVQKDSPAELAGMRIGDMVLRQDDQDLVADPPGEPRFAGDTIQLVVLREGATVPITVVLGRWDPAEETPDQPRICRPVESASSRS